MRQSRFSKRGTGFFVSKVIQVIAIVTGEMNGKGK